MSKARITITFELEINPDHYPEAIDTPEKALDFAQNEILNDPFMIAEILCDTDYQLKGELL